VRKINVEELKILIKAETEGVTKQVNGVKKDLAGISKTSDTMQKDMGKSLSSAVGHVKKFALAITATVASLGLIAKSSASALDRIDKDSQRLNMSTKQFQEWDYILSQSGGSIDELGESMATLISKIAEASTGKSVEVFDKLGISVRNSNGELKSQGVIFEEAVNGLTKVSNNTEKAILAQQLFGESSKKLAPLLNGSTEDIARMKEEAYSLGIVLDDASIKAGAQFTDAMDKMKRALAPIGASLIQAFLPLVQSVIPWIVRLSSAIRTAVAYIVALFTILFKSNKSSEGIAENIKKTEVASNNIGISTASNLAGATAEAKKLKGQLLGFDEINTLTQTTTGGGATSDGGAIDQPAIGVPDLGLGELSDELLTFSDEVAKATEIINEKLNQQIGGFELWKLLLAGAIAGVVAALGIMFGGQIYLAFEYFIVLLDSAFAPVEALISALRPMFGLMGALGIVMAIVVVVVVAIIAALIEAYNKFEWFRDGVNDALTNTGIFFMNLYTSFIKPVATSIITMLLDVWNRGLKPLWDAFVRVIANIAMIFIDLYNAIVPILTAIIHILGPVFAEVLNFLIVMIGNSIVGAISIFTSLLDSINTIIEGIRIVFSGMIDFLVGVFTGDWDKAWTGILNIIRGVVTIIEGIVDIFIGVFSTILTFIGTNFVLGWKTAWEGIGNVFGTVFDGVKNTFKGIINFIIGGMNKMIKGINTISVDIPDWMADLAGVKGGKIGFNLASIPQLASGGMVSSGQMFIANEAGAELVGSFGSKTGVMNNDQIVESVSQGVYRAVVSAMSSNSSGSQEVNLVVDGVKLGRILLPKLDEEASRLGFQTILQER